MDLKSIDLESAYAFKMTVVAALFVGASIFFGKISLPSMIVVLLALMLVLYLFRNKTGDESIFHPRNVALYTIIITTQVFVTTFKLSVFTHMGIVILACALVGTLFPIFRSRKNNRLAG